MQLSKETIEYIHKVIKVAKVLKIENVILDKDSVRGLFHEEGVCILQKTHPEFEFQSLGISRISTLDSRLTLLGDDVSIEVEEKEKTPTEKIVSKLSLSNDRTNIEFRCADPKLLPKAYTVIKDPIAFTFTITSDSVATLSRAQSAMTSKDATASKNMTFKGSAKGVVAKLNDVGGDMLTHVITDSLTFAPTAKEDKFQLIFNTSIIVPILKNAIGNNDELMINITERGIMTLNFWGIDIYIHREVV